MLKEAQAGKVPDYSVSLKSKVRSVHNTYFTFPVLFIMLSNHYAAVYSHPQAWILLIILSISGALVRHAMVTKNKMQRWTLLPAAIGLLALVFMTAKQPETVRLEHTEKVEYLQVQGIVQMRCLSCHATVNTDDVFKVAVNNVIFETEASLLKYKETIIRRVILEKSMPFQNKTKMTEQERAILAKWLSQ
jgi:uncharacterized membrane protein